jgi:two-component system, chemotaxis family, response regulator Rcp1
MKTAEILLVEDNPGDVVLLREALERAGWDHRLHVARDGIEAIEFLRQQGRHADAVRPDLVILDLNLPAMDGRDVLANIRFDPVFEGIPLVLMSSSRIDDDILQTYELPQDACFVKRLLFDDYVEIARRIKQIWHDAARRDR